MTNEEFQELVLEQLAGLKTDISDLKTDVSALKTDVSSLREQTSENNHFIQALLHRTEELDAKLDRLAIRPAKNRSLTWTPNLTFSINAFSSKKPACSD